MLVKKVVSSASWKLRRSVGCSKLDVVGNKIFKALSINEERVKNAYRDVSLQHCLALTSAVVSNKRFREFSFADDLLKHTKDLLKPYTARGSKDRLGLEMVYDMFDCLIGYKNKDFAEMTETDQAMVINCLTILKRNYLLLNRGEKEEIKNITSQIIGLADKIPDEIRHKAESLEKHMEKVTKMKSSTYTKEYLEAWGLESYLDTEKAFEFEFIDKYDCLEIRDVNHKKSFALFNYSNFDNVGQIMRYKQYLEDTPDIDSLVIDVSPALNPELFNQLPATEQKMLEYSQTLINDWPFTYKFHGKADLRKLYFSMVFDSEFYEEIDQLFYYKPDKNSRVLDVTNTMLAYFSGFGDRTSSPSVYLSSTLGEERTMEGVFRVDLQKAKALNDLYSLLHLLGGLNLIDSASQTGCRQCGGWLNSLIYYQLIEKIYRSEYESSYVGNIASSIMHEAFQRLPEGTKGVYASSSSSFDKTLPLIMDKIRQKRLSGYDPLEFKRSDHPKTVFNQWKNQNIDEGFFEKLAYVENVIGNLESTLCQFIDLVKSENPVNHYQHIKTNLFDYNTLANWDPSYNDSQPGDFCLAENTILPFAIETPPQQKRVWYSANPKDKQFDLVAAVKEKVEKFEKTSDEEKHGKGRKLKMKPRALTPDPDPRMASYYASQQGIPFVETLKNSRSGKRNKNSSTK